MDIVWAIPGADGWASVAQALQAIHEAAPAAPASAAYDGAEGVTAVMCGDAPSRVAGAIPDARFGGHAAFRPLRSLDLLHGGRSLCGAVDRPLSAALLVVNTTRDPSTPMRNAEAMAVLLRVDGFGHTSLLNRSTCADDRIAAYLVDLRLPPAHAWCVPDRQPFED